MCSQLERVLSKAATGGEVIDREPPTSDERVTKHAAGPKLYCRAPEMTTGRLVFVCLFLAVAGVMTAVGIEDGKLTELLYVSWIPGLIGLIALATAKKVEPAPVINPADWRSKEGTGAAGQQALHALGTAHRFTPAHLEANRAGTLHPEQIASGIRRGKIDINAGTFGLALGVALFLAGVATSVFPEAIKHQDFTFSVPKKAAAVYVGIFLGGLAGTLPLLFGFVAFRHGRNVKRAYEAGKAASIEGPLKLLEVRRSRGGGSSYYYVMNNQRLWLVNGGWKAVTPGAQYKVHFVPNRFEVLSLEPR